ncbi:hypothetical protein C4568_02725 [Candidatus Parcubacteria bacterium]|nr:MAG: hypothetical protein C4568_02725 [Candidatus Parcubacteria bacterium]
MSERIYQVVIGVLVLVVLVGGWMMIAGKRAKPSTTMAPVSTTEEKEEVSGEEKSDAKPSEAASPAAPSKPASGEAVKVVDQTAGKMVAVESVTLKNRGWVAIEDDKEWILGAARLEAGTHEDVEVELLRATVKGGTYKAILFVDDGDGKFDMHKDTVIKNSDGSTLSAAFITK